MYIKFLYENQEIGLKKDTKLELPSTVVKNVYQVK